MGDLKKVGRVGVKALVYFEVVSTLALLIGVIIGEFITAQAGLGYLIIFATARADTEVSMAAIVVWPTARPKTNRLVALAGRASATLGSATNRLEAWPPSWMTRPEPASTVMPLEAAATGCGAGRASAGMLANALASRQATHFG